MWDIFITDPLVKRSRRMSKIQEKLKEGAVQRREITLRLEELTEEYEKLKREAKGLKKTGRLPSEK